MTFMNTKAFFYIILFFALINQSTISKVKITGRVFEGKILKVKEVLFKDSSQKNIVVLMKTPRGHQEMIVDLGDSERIKEQAQTGTKLKVEGIIIKIENKEFLLAKRVAVGKRLLKVNKGRKLRRP